MAPRKKLDNARHHLFSVAGLLNLAIGNAEEKQAYDELRTWFKEFVQACRADNDGGQREQAAVEKLNSIAEPFKGYKKNTRPSLELIKQWFKDHKARFAALLSRRGTPKQVFEELGVEYPPPAAAPAAPVYDDSTSDPQGYQEYDYGTAANPYYVDDTPGPSSYRAYRDARTPGPPLRRSHSPLHEAPPAPTHQGYMSVEDAQALSGWGHPGGSSSYAGPSNNYNQDQHHYQSLARRAASAHGTVARTRAGWSPRVFAWQ
ncbi:hypothetical protein JCM10207_005380 [Rhodosporidiobolus poonsookiae]